MNSSSESIRFASQKDISPIVDFLVKHATILPDTLPVDRKSHFTERIIEFIAAAEKGVIILGEGEIRGVLLFERLAFDSEHFGVESGRINDFVIDDELQDGESVLTATSLLRAFLEEAESRGFVFIQCKLDARYLKAASCLEEEGFSLVSREVALLKELGEEKESGLTRPFTGNDVETIASLSRRCYTLTRFHSDPRIPRERADELQATWARNCCLHGLADQVLVVESAGKVVGYLACGIENSPRFIHSLLGRIILVCVDPASQGSGFGSALLKDAERWCFHAGCTHLCVETQLKNDAAIRAYTARGFRESYGLLAFHRWMPAHSIDATLSISESRNP